MAELWEVRPLYPSPKTDPSNPFAQQSLTKKKNIFDRALGGVDKGLSKLGAGAQKGFEEFTDASEWYNANVVQPLGGMFTSTGQQRFWDNPGPEGWKGSGDAWRENQTLPGWLKTTLEMTALDPTTYTMLGPAGSLMKMAGQSGKLSRATLGASRLGVPLGEASMKASKLPPLAAFDALQTFAFNSTIRNPIRGVGTVTGLGRPTVAAQAERASAEAWNYVAHIGGDRMVSKRYADTVSLVEDILTAPETTPAAGYARHYVMDNADRIMGINPSRLEGFWREFGDKLPEVRKQNLGKFITEKTAGRTRVTPEELATQIREHTRKSTVKNLQAGIAESRAAADTFPSWLGAKALDSMDSVARASVFRGMNKYFVTPLSRAYLSFVNYAPFNAIEDIMKSILGQAGPGARSAQDLRRVYLGVDMDEETSKHVLAFLKDEEMGQLPSQAGKGTNLRSKIIDAVKKDPASLGISMSNEITRPMRFNALHQMQVNRVGSLPTEHALDDIEGMLQALPAEYPHLVDDARVRLGTPGMNQLADKVLPDRVIRASGNEILALNSDLPPSARTIAVDWLHQDTGARIEDLPTVLQNMKDAAAADIADMASPKVMEDATKQTQHYLNYTGATKENSLLIHQAATSLMDIYAAAYPISYRQAVRTSMGKTSIAQGRMYDIATGVQEELHSKNLPKVRKAVEAARKKLDAIAPELAADLDVHLKEVLDPVADAHNADMALRHKTFQAKGAKRPRTSEEWNDFYAARSAIFDKLKADAADLNAARLERTQNMWKSQGMAPTPEAQLTHPVPDYTKTKLDAIERAEAQIDELGKQFEAEIKLKPGVEEKYSAVQEQLQKIEDAFNALPEEKKAAYLADKKERMRVATGDFTRMFPDYHNEIVFDKLMQGIFPYWRYEAHRLRWLPDTLTRYPWLSINLARYMNGTDEGYMPTVGGVEINPLRGTILGSIRRMVGKDFPQERQGAIGNINRLTDQLQRWGLYTGPQVEAPRLLAEAAVDKTFPKLGEMAPPAVTTTLDAANYIPGIGPEVDKFRTTFLGDRYREYLIRKELAVRGVNPDEATPEDRRSVLKKISLLEGMEQQLSITRYRPDAEKEYRRTRAEAYAEVLRVPVEEVQKVFESGQRPQDVWAISPSQQTLLDEKLSSTQMWNAVSLPLRAPKAQAVAERSRKFWTEWDAVASVFRSGQAEGKTPEEATAMMQAFGMQTSQAQDDALLSEGQISGNVWRDRRSRRQAAQAAAWAAFRQAYADVPVTDADKQRMYPDYDLPKIHPARQAINDYFGINPQAFVGPDGGVDWEAFSAAREEFLNQLDPSTRNEVDTYVQRNWTPSEKKYGEVRAIQRELMALPVYQNVPKAREDEVQDVLQIAADLRQFNPKAPRQQLLVQAARSKGYAPAVAALAARAKPNPARAKFRQKHPELALFYSDILIGQPSGRSTT